MNVKQLEHWIKTNFARKSRLSTLTGDLVRKDGSTPLTAEWDTGEDMAIRAERLEARDSEGLRLEDDGGNLGLLINDGGLVSFGNGVSFGNETLNVYDEGTWTPAITTSGVAPTTLTYTAQTGEYTRIGRILFYNIRIIINAFTLGPGTGDIRISLPVAVASGAQFTNRGMLSVQGVDMTTPISIALAPSQGSSIATLVSNQDNAAQVVEQIAALGAGDIIVATGFYFVT